MFTPGSKVKFSLKYAPYVYGLCTILEIYTGEGVPCVYSVEIEEVIGYNTYKAGDVILIFPHEVEKEAYFI